MTVESQTSWVQYNTNATTGPWSVPFYFLEDSHLAVTYTNAAGVDTALVLDAGFTVTGAGDSNGGSVTTDTAYASGGTITIRRSVPATQEVDYVDTDPFPAETHETALDKLTMLVQQQDAALDQCLRVPEVSGIDELPAIASRANKFLAFDSDGEPSLTAIEDLSDGATAETEFTATEDQTNFTLGAAISSVSSVFLNGLRLASDDFTLSTSTLVVLTEPAAEYDELTIKGVLA